MTEDFLLGLDAGTTSTKAVVMSLDGRERAHGRAATPWRKVPGGAELDPFALTGATISAARAATGGVRGRILGVGVASMAETGVLLDRSGEPVTPMIAWHDERGDDEAEELGKAIGEGPFSRQTGLPVSRLCTLSKYRWMRSHLPESERGIRWLNVAEWLVRSLGGDESCELSLASRTGWFDLASRRPWQEVLEWAEAPRDLLPEPAGAGTLVGRLTTGLPEAAGAALAVAGHDHVCAAVGAGMSRPGDVFNSCGTAEAFVRAVHPPLPPPDVERAVAGGITVGWHVTPGSQALMSGFVSGLALQRFLDLLGVAERDRGRLDAESIALPPGAEGVVVRDVTADRVVVGGIPRSVSPAHVWLAALEAIARHSGEVLGAIEAIVGPTERLAVTGGWARSEAVRAVKRRVLGPFEEPGVEEAGARGAALIAGLAAGVYEGIDALPPVPSKPI
jgi:sugar (pentulose or hexulose) kinase